MYWPIITLSTLPIPGIIININYRAFNCFVWRTMRNVDSIEKNTRSEKLWLKMTAIIYSFQTKGCNLYVYRLVLFNKLFKDDLITEMYGSLRRGTHRYWHALNFSGLQMLRKNIACWRKWQYHREATCNAMPASFLTAVGPATKRTLFWCSEWWFISFFCLNKDNVVIKLDFSWVNHKK